ncbi:hypothetical protein SUGI_0098860 [Cryptomeria japonica]|uniref:probable leucine-rich repeat receptor-like protein kinase At1g68400 n=1 Tax=Cryptomeria japonica TaxID=3369 RepID=UPI002408BBC9|nr:probable leucine-rich repeat receptor-like protein kinase At1g68400 [Cryptomeria japonica]GLJ08938.1 hypothetical protein SUGI_0098860 [Cryptomeria japonica]
MDKPILIILLMNLVLLNLLNFSYGDDDEALKKLLNSFQNKEELRTQWNSTEKPCINGDNKWPYIKCLENSDKVRALILNNINLGGTVDEEALAELSELRVLSLTNCGLSGKVPDLSKLDKLKYGYLDGNNFSGPIRDNMFQSMPALRILRFNNNDISGSMPSALTGLTYLAELSLQNNDLDGRIPELKQDNLTVFNVSFNHLTGKIPESMSQRFGKDSFLGNSGLCGSAVDKACKKESGSKLKPWLIVVIVVADIAGLLILSLIFVYFYRRRNMNKEKGSNAANNGRSSSSAMKVFPNENLWDNGVTQSSTITEESFYKESTKGNNFYDSNDVNKLVFFDGSNFGLEELLRASAELMTKGNFGTVYRAIMDNGSVIVVKRLREFCKLGEKQFDDYMLFLGKLRHQNILPLKGYFGKEEKLLLYDFMLNGTLLSLLHGNRGANKVPGDNRKPLDWKARLKIMVGVARGLAYLEKECSARGIPIAHGHLKSSNILIDAENEPRLCDYALQPLISSPSVHKMVAYQAPESLKTKAFTPSAKADVWSFGVLLLELLTGKPSAHSPPPGKAGSPEAIDLPRYVNSVVREEWTGEVFDREISLAKSVEGEMLQILQIAMWCTDASPEKRPDIEVVLKKIEQVCERGEESGSIDYSDGESGASFCDYTGEFSFSTTLTPQYDFHTGTL